MTQLAVAASHGQAWGPMAGESASTELPGPRPRAAMRIRVNRDRVEARSEYERHGRSAAIKILISKTDLQTKRPLAFLKFLSLYGTYRPFKFCGPGRLLRDPAARAGTENHRSNSAKNLIT